MLGADGDVLAHEGSSGEAIATYGARSLRHLDPMPDGYFAQTSGVIPPLGTPIRVPVRFLPTDRSCPPAAACG